MKQTILKWTVLLVIILPLTIPVYGQTKKKKKKDDTEFIDKLWVGGAFGSGLQFGNRTFALGLTPMVGYELVPNFSVGPFVRLDYYYQRLTTTPPHIKFE